MQLELATSMLEGLTQPLLLVGSDERVWAANGAAREMLGTAIDGRHYVTVLRQPGLIDAIEGVLRHRQPMQARFTLSGVTRESIFNVVVSPVGGEGLRGVLVSFHDTSDAEQIGQMRRDFVANVSHELRTPLTALLGFIETLKGAARDDANARDRFLTIMEREAERMNRLVHDLLSLSRVEAEERVRPTARVDLAALVQSSVAALKPMATVAGVAIEVTGAEAPISIQADPDQLTQVFNNLIENAVKYGGAGKQVTVALHRVDRDPALRGPALYIDVIDRGEGIDAIHIPRLTERFYRVDTHRSREKGGTGLGLAIVKHIVNRHRGRFRIESEKGEGSRFSVVLPIG